MRKVRKGFIKEYILNESANDSYALCILILLESKHRFVEMLLKVKLLNNTYSHWFC